MIFCNILVAAVGSTVAFPPFAEGVNAKVFSMAAGLIIIMGVIPS
jgi:hypothetical protein